MTYQIKQNYNKIQKIYQIKHKVNQKDANDIPNQTQTK